MTHPDEARPACEGQGELHDSPFYAEHLKAKENCKACPAHLFAACKRLAAAPEQNQHDGTWAGVLYRNGRVAVRGQRPPGKSA